MASFLSCNIGHCFNDLLLPGSLYLLLNLETFSCICYQTNFIFSFCRLVI